MKFVAVLIVLFVCPVLLANPISIKNEHFQILIDPQTLETAATTATGKNLPISGPGDKASATDLQTLSANSARWRRNGVAVSAQMIDAGFTITFTSDAPGKITWPRFSGGNPVKAVILPSYEGAYIPTDDPQWRDFLISQSPYDTTAGLVMPFWGLQFDLATLTYILPDPYNNELAFTKSGDIFAATLTHEFTPNQQQKAFSVIVQLTGDSPVAPAKAYRQYLVDHHQFVSLKRKIEQTPNAARLIGASQIYIWGSDLLSRYDVRDWKTFAPRIQADAAIYSALTPDAQTQVKELISAGYQSDYAKTLVASELSKLGTDKLIQTFPDAFTDPKTWGDGVSTKMLDALHAAGLEHLCITTGDLTSAADKPQVAARANDLGYLFGPYDSYDAVHRPGEANTWETAQFDQKLYDTGAVVLRNGTKKTGFQKKGFLLSPIAAQPYVERRVNALEAKVPFTSWFVDCDAFGDVFDDYSPLHPATQDEFARARCDRLAWINRSHNLVIGSEGGTAFAAPFIHFAHGMITPVIGWGDKDLTSKTSKYYLGAYFPPDGPAVFFKSVPLKPYYQKFFFDPRYRLPLYETVFHDSVIATHHWSTSTLKFSDQIQTVELLEQLYNVPPLYHINLAEFKKRRERIIAHDAFFAPLHRDLAEQAMTDFAFLTPDRMVQRTVFANGTEIIANFGQDPFTYAGQTILPHGVVAHVSNTSEDRVFTPQP